MSKRVVGAGASLTGTGSLAASAIVSAKERPMDVAEKDPVDVDSFAWPAELVDVGRHIKQAIVDVLNTVERDREGHGARDAEGFVSAVYQVAGATTVPGQGLGTLGELLSRMGLHETLGQVARAVEGSARA